MDSRMMSLLFAVLLALVTMSGEQVSVDNAPRIITNNGNLLFQTGNLKAIQFETKGSGDIKFNDINIRDFYGQMTDIKTFINQNRNSFNQCDCNAMKLNIASNSAKVRDLNNQLTRVKMKLTNIGRLVTDLKRISTIDECSSNPCHNGGVCVDGFGTFKCLCKDQFKGTTCLEDVDECTQLAGTDLGCQNNARCQNYFGGFRCICTGKWAGVLCNNPQNGCMGSSNIDLCGHGQCVADHSVNNPRSFACICDHGWKLDPQTKTCINDVNECEVGRHPCSEDPLVPCYNTPGSFSCGQCPPGYQGNGFSCSDVNECLQPNMCRVNEVCTNNRGSHRCQCIEGMTYNPDGICQRQNICTMDNGGCNLNAQCTPNSYSMEGRSCVCNSGYIGNGVGINGCVLGSTGNATNFRYRRCVRRQLCRNGGTCLLTSTGFTCQCLSNFTGPRCRNQLINQCLPNPCLNGGICTPINPNNYHCSCTPSFTGRNCETEHSECGGTIISPRYRREINFLVDPSESTRVFRYPCVWTVIVTDEKFLQMKPINITRQWSSSCTTEYIQILEKSTAESDSRELVKYCRENPMGQISGLNTSGPILIIKAQFPSRGSGHGGFAIGITPVNFWIQNLDCCRCQNGNHEMTFAPNGIFSSPSYPLNYPESNTCVMEYVRPFGATYRVTLLIDTIDLGDSNGNCSETDYVQIIYVERGETKITACNQATFQNQRFITSGFKIRFQSDSTTGLSPSKFRFTWRNVSNTDPCGGIMSFENTGSIEAPALTENQEAYCTWNVHRSNSSQMILLKGFFNYWQNGDCSVYIKVLNLDLNGTTRVLYEQCQSSSMLDQLMEEMNGQLIIIFRKPIGVTTPSFRIQVTFVCGKVIDMDQLDVFDFSSPNYPGNYDNDLNCTYKFVARTRRFSVDFKEFDIADDSPCNSDYVSIKGATKWFSNGKVCNGNFNELVPIDKDPSTENLVINFITNSSGTGQGFRVRVSLLECGGSYFLTSRLVIAHPESHINDSGSDIQYGHNMICVWNIVSHPGTYMILSFDHFHLEYHSNCNYDSLALTYDNVTNRKYCGNNIPHVITKSNRLKMVFTSDYSVSGEGFIARMYHFGSQQSHCHQDIRAPEGALVGPPIGSLVRPIICIYSITVPNGRKVVLNITIDNPLGGNSTTAPPSKCFGKGKLRIKNGFLGAATKVDVCPEFPQRGTIKLDSNKAIIMYMVYAYRSAYEFNFTIGFHSIDEECGSIIHDDSGEIASPNYPLTAAPYSYCQWEVHSTPGQKILIQITSIKAGSYSQTINCDDNKNPVLKFVSASKEISIGCERHIEELYNFEDPMVRIIFNNHQSSQYRFRLKYKKDCRFTTNSTSGRFEISNVIPFQQCSWKINILRGNTLHLHFDQFDLPNQVNEVCKAYVRISDSLRLLMDKTCGNTLINNVYQSSNSPVNILYMVRYDLSAVVAQAHRGFTLEYNTEGCVYNINYDPEQLSSYGRPPSRVGSFSSPQYPTSISGQDCIWKFKTVFGKSIKLIFDVIQLDNFQNCSQGPILQIRESEASSEPYALQMCQSVSPSHPNIYQASASFLFLKFSSANDENGGHRKFHATYEFIDSTCQYQLTATEGIIKSPNYPGLYPKNINCRWELSVRQGMSIHFHFLDLDIEGSNCRYDYVQIYSELNTESMPMDRLCGTYFNPAQLYQSFDNKMLVTFKTDYSVQKRGFKARFFEGCGGLRKASEVIQFLTSPNYPHEYTLPDGVCEWTIIANVSNPGERIFFHFFGFETDSSDLGQNCSLSHTSAPNNSLSIIDGLDNTIIKAVLCSNQPAMPIVSTGPFLKVILKSSNGRSIFKAGFSTGSSACGGEYFLNDGILTSPFYPNALNNDMDCIYVIKNSPGSEVDLTIEEFIRTNPTSYIMHDYLEIRTGVSYVNSRLIGRFYTQESLQNATSNVRFNDSVILRFRSQGGQYTNTIKFLARYHINYQSEFQSEEGMLGSPQFGHLYKSDADMTWTIFPMLSQSIDIEFLNFSVGRQLQNGNCERGVLTITDSAGNSRTFCGPNLPRKQAFVVPVSIRLEAQGFRYGGFLLKWSAARNESHTRIGPCKYVIRATNSPQILTSPNFPNFDPINRDCQWTIVAPNGRAIDLEILNFTMEDSRNCKYENFTISLRTRYIARGPNRYYYYPYRNVQKMFCGSQNNSILSFTNNLIFNSVTIKFKADEADFFPGFKLQYKLKCFREITKYEGWLQSEGFPNTMTEFKNCTYIFRINVMRYYKFNFTAISLPAATNNICTDGYINISTTHLIGTFCGSNVPASLTPLLTNSSIVTINMAGSFDRFPGFSGFKMRYSLIEVEECGGRRTLSGNTDEIFITNPRNGSTAPHSIECKWSISSPYGTRIKIDFLLLTIQSRTRCLNSFLALYDGSTTLSPKIGGKNYCSRESTVFSSSNRLLIFFKNFDAYATFNIRLSIGLCGGTLYKPNGIITSPNYPSNYPQQTRCVWSIRSTIAHSVTIAFDDMSLSCSRANLTIYTDENPPMTNWSSCRDAPNTIYTMTNRVQISFNTDQARAGRGFKLLYRSRRIECGGTKTDPSGELTSVNYPASIPQGLVCWWSIEADVTKRVTIRILNLNLGQACLRIYSRNRVIKQFCRQNIENYDFDTKTSKLVLVLFSNDGQSRISFSYHTDQISLCGSHIYPGTNTTGLIRFEGNSSIEYCQHIVHNYPGETGTIAFKPLSEAGLECGKNSLAFQSIVAGVPGVNYIVDNFDYCMPGNALRIIYTTLGKLVDVTYETHPYRSLNNQSITLAYKYQDCGGMLTEPYGYISSPNYPNRYPDHSNCEWIIKTSTDMHIRLVIIALHLESHATCGYDYLYIRSGPEFDSPPVKQFCGRHNITNETVIFRNNLLRLSFKSDFSASETGFLIQYNFINAVDNCNGFVFNVTGTIQSPNYPRAYPSNTRCNWTVLIPQGYQIELTMHHFDLEPAVNNQCFYDALEITDSNPDVVIARLCGTHPPTRPILSSENRVGILFSTDFNLNLDGFQLTYRSLCGGIFNNTYGQINSPTVYLEGLSYIMQCKYTIPSWKNYLTVLSITTALNLCRYSYGYVEVWKETSPGQYAFGQRVCGRSPQPVVIFNSLSMIIKFNITYYGVKQYSFRATYFHEESVRVYNNFTGRQTIRTPHFPTPYHHNADLRWKFNAPLNYIFYVQFTDIDIESSTFGCIYDYVAIYRGTTINSTNLETKLCGLQKMTIPLRIDSNNISIHFVSDSSHYANHTGFRATIISTPSPLLGCGGEIYLDPSSVGTISSVDLNNDGFYENWLLCDWKFFAPPGYIVQLRFENSSVALERRSRNQCKYDWIKIYDGAHLMSPLIITLCGNDSVDPIQSSGRNILVRFHTDISITDRGFRIHYSVLQSQTNVYLNATSEYQVWSSPSYPGRTEYNFKSRIEISAVNDSDHILLEVKELSIRSTANCSLDSFQVMDDSMRHANQLRKFCKSIELPIPFISSDNRVVAKYKIGPPEETENLPQLRYQIQYKIYNCTRNEKAYSGRIVNIETLKGRSYSHNSTCNLTLEAPAPNLKYQFYFKRFILENSETCRYDYIQFIFGAPTEEQTISPKMCGSSLPPTLFSNSSYVTMTFVSDPSISLEGYDITYVVNRDPLKLCGGDIDLDSGVITSPGYGRNTYDMGQCTWNIATISQKVLSWKITDLQLGASNIMVQSCSTSEDYVQVTSNGNIQRFCGNILPNQEYHALSGRFIVEYKSTNGGIGIGFKLEWNNAVISNSNDFIPAYG